MASKYINKFQTPKGFEDIINDFAKEIIRNQPKDLIDFGCEYFKCLQEGTVLDYKFKGDNLPCDYVPKIPTKPKITYAKNSLAISQEDTGRLKSSLEQIEQLKKYDMPLREEVLGEKEGFGPIVEKGEKKEVNNEDIKGEKKEEEKKEDMKTKEETIKVEEEKKEEVKIEEKKEEIVIKEEKNEIVKEEEKKNEAPKVPELTNEEKLLTEIRDLPEATP